MLIQTINAKKTLQPSITSKLAVASATQSADAEVASISGKTSLPAAACAKNKKNAMNSNILIATLVHANASTTLSASTLTIIRTQRPVNVYADQ